MIPTASYATAVYYRETAAAQRGQLLLRRSLPGFTDALPAGVTKVTVNNMHLYSVV